MKNIYVIIYMYVYICNYICFGAVWGPTGPLWAPWACFWACPCGSFSCSGLLWEAHVDCVSACASHCCLVWVRRDSRWLSWGPLVAPGVALRAPMQLHWLWAFWGCLWGFPHICIQYSSIISSSVCKPAGKHQSSASTIVL